MTAADVFAMPSTGEPCALVYLEAMAVGLPIIALDDGGTPELVVHERQGLLSTHGDVEALASNLRRLLSDEELRPRWVRAGGRASPRRSRRNGRRRTSQTCTAPLSLMVRSNGNGGKSG